jgi:hypothetical protein
MKRYMSSILIICVIVFSIGTYYVTKAVFASDLPQYSFKTIEGNEEELKPVIIKGSFQKHGVYENVMIHDNQTTYESERSYFERLDTQIIELKNLQTEYRSFMRGKNNIYAFYEDEDFLAYGSVDTDYPYNGTAPSHTFDIGLLDKNSNDETSFQLPVPNQQSYNYVSVEDVQFVESKLKIVTRNETNSNETSQPGAEIHVYTLDLANQEITEDEIVTSEESSSEQYVNISLISDADITKSNDVIVIYTNKTKETVLENGNVESEQIGQSLMAYSFENKQKKNIELPKELENPQKMINQYFDGENLYFLERQTEGVRLLTYQINSEETLHDFQFPIKQEGTGEFSLIMKNDRVYMLANNQKDGKEIKPPELLIGDIKTGKTLYHGVLQREKQNKENLYNDDYYWIEVE